MMNAYHINTDRLSILHLSVKQKVKNSYPYLKWYIYNYADILSEQEGDRQNPALDIPDPEGRPGHKAPRLP